MVWHYNINDNCRQNTNIEKIYVYASERRKLLHFHIQNCYFFQYFVGTSETLSVQMTYLSAYMYRKNSEKNIIGGKLPPCPPHPPPPHPLWLR